MRRRLVKRRLPSKCGKLVNDDQLLRYARHLLLDEIGIEGQERLLSAHVLIVGAGGLGSPVAMYLAAAGVGQLTLVDHDHVDLTNLQRQIAHTTRRVGQLKVESARQMVLELNPDTVVHALAERIDTPERARELIEPVDAVVDCTDNFAIRALLNAVCVELRKPLVSGAAIRFEGQVTVFDLRAPDAPCYACLFPDSADEVAPVNCATMGVFSPLVGMVGTIQAAETLKLLVRAGSLLSGRLLRVDALNAEWRSVRVRRDPQCPVCSRPHEGAIRAVVPAGASCQH